MYGGYIYIYIYIILHTFYIWMGLSSSSEVQTTRMWMDQQHLKMDVCLDVKGDATTSDAYGKAR